MLWIKALHVMAIISWMAGMFYLPRLFVYHCQSATGSDQSTTFKTMEAKLLKIIMGPAMMVSWVTGLILAYFYQFWLEPWFMIKLAMVIMMTIFHIYLTRCARDFAADNNQKSEKFFRLANEVPTLLMAIIVIMVIVKPF